MCCTGHLGNRRMFKTLVPQPSCGSLPLGGRPPLSLFPFFSLLLLLFLVVHRRVRSSETERRSTQVDVKAVTCLCKLILKPLEFFFPKFPPFFVLETSPTSFRMQWGKWRLNCDILPHVKFHENFLRRYFVLYFLYFISQKPHVFIACSDVSHWLDVSTKRKRDERKSPGHSVRIWLLYLPTRNFSKSLFDCFHKKVMYSVY